nr:hypothetical protein [Methyloceanibacter superfactus]
MTTAATVVAMVRCSSPGGAGAAARFSIGVVIAAGMTIGTLFTLFVTPTIYTYLARDHQKARARGTAAPEPSKEALTELDAAAEAGVLFPAEAEETQEETPPGPAAAEAQSGRKPPTPPLRARDRRERAAPAGPAARACRRRPNRAAKAVSLVYSPPACL